MAEGTTSEPSIEEILASIRKIISDDEGDSDAGEPPTMQAMPAAQHEAWQERDNAGEDEDVLDLTDIAEEPPVTPALSEEIIEASPISSPEVSNVTDFPQAVNITNEKPSEPSMPSEEGSIITAQTMAAATGAFAKLSHESDPPERTSGDGRTVEDITRELLRPMLREWMDHNLAQIVERLVERELRKISRKAEDL